MSFATLAVCFGFVGTHVAKKLPTTMPPSATVMCRASKKTSSTQNVRFLFLLLLFFFALQHKTTATGLFFAPVNS
jgi:hypothetical protein